jgi:hypothetical protein
MKTARPRLATVRLRCLASTAHESDLRGLHEFACLRLLVSTALIGLAQPIPDAEIGSISHIRRTSPGAALVYLSCPRYSRYRT